MAACVIALLAGFFLKERCSDPRANSYRDLCYNDVQPLYGIREVESEFPYVNGSLHDGELEDGAIEYPVLTGVFMWGAARFASDYKEYLEATALLLAPFGLYAAYLLARMVGRRALLLAASGAMVLYSFHNWDLLVVAATVAGIFMWYRGRYLWAAVIFGVGGALKLFPAFFLLPLALERWHAGDRSGAVRAAGAGAATLALVNLPFAVLNFDGWWATYEFHQQRLPNFDNLWLIGLSPTEVDSRFTPETLNLLTGILIGGFFLAALALGWIRARKEGAFPFIAVCGALLAAFLLWNKVHSPQYALWLMPFFVLLRVSILWWIAYGIADLFVYVGVFRWFYDYGISQSLTESTWAKQLLITGVWARAALLLVLFFLFLRARSALEPDEAVLSHPSRTVRSTAEPA